MSSSVISAKGLSNAAPAAARSLSTLLMMRAKTSFSSPRRLLHAQAHEAERAALVEDHHQDDPAGDDRDVDVVALALVEQDREFLLADEPRQAVGRGHVARGERGEGGGVEVLDLALCGDLLAVLVDQEHDLGVRVDAELRDDRLDLVELLLVHDDVGRGHSVVPPPERTRTPPPQERKRSGTSPRETHKGSLTYKRNQTCAGG